MKHKVAVMVAVVLAVTAAWMPPTALAQDPPPPALGSAVLADGLSGPGLFRPSACQTGRGGRDFVGEGFRLRLTGRCNEAHTITGTGVRVPGLTVADGEVRLDVKAVSGVERVKFQLAVRDRPSTAEFSDAYYILVDPGIRRATIGKTNEPQAAVVREDLGEIVAPEEWNTLALRMEGPNIWLLVNDQVALFWSDPRLDRGEVFLNLFRRSTSGHPIFDDDPNDTTEVAIVIRNLVVSALADGDPTRAPVYQRP